MATTISRTAITDDDGTGTTGTVLNNAWKTQFYDQIDALFSGATFVLSGVVTASGFGTHTFSAGGTGGNALSLVNTTSGAANWALMSIGTDATGGNVYLQSFPSGFSTSDNRYASGSRLVENAAGGLSIGASHASGVIRLYAGGTTLRATLGTGGAWQWNAYGSGAISSDASGNITASDARFKTILRPYKGGLAEILRLHPSVYRWNEESGWDTTHEYLGFTAQDVEQAIPGAVPGFDLNSGKRLNYDDRAILAAFANAFREIDSRLSAGAAELAALKASVAALEERAN